MQDWNKPQDNSNNPFARMSIRDQLINLDERIARFETGAAYEGNESNEEYIASRESAAKRMQSVIDIVEELNISRFDKARIFSEIKGLQKDLKLEGLSI